MSSSIAEEPRDRSNKEKPLLGDSPVHEATCGISEESQEHSDERGSVFGDDVVHDAASSIHRSEVDHFSFGLIKKN